LNKGITWSNFPGPWIENKTLPDFDDRGGNVLENIWVREEEIIDIIRESPLNDIPPIQDPQK
jgi:hypothetical protein